MLMTTADAREAASLEPGSDERLGDFSDYRNIVGRKDHQFGTHIMPGNEMACSGQTQMRIRLEPDRTLVGRQNPKLATAGRVPAILVTAADGPVHYEVAYWATPLPGVKDRKRTRLANRSQGLSDVDQGESDQQVGQVCKCRRRGRT